MSSKPSIPVLGKLLQDWYMQNQRPLPWRQTQDPYKIWVSEVMLQQTTVTAVIPYYHRFLDKYPTVQALAQASLNEVYSLWAGLGYYSRAKNLHRAAGQIAQQGFPQTAEQLHELPGFGPYTSRAVASIAFKQPTGVVDGNVIRVLSRVFGVAWPWWETQYKNRLQKMADEFAKSERPDLINQALMELGATICTPQSPSCLLCPWMQSCTALRLKKTKSLPLKKAKRKNEVWVWKPQVIIKAKKIALIKNNYAPFLKGQLIFPGSISQSKQKPKKYDAKHGITHHEIYIQVNQRLKSKLSNKEKIQWIPLDKLSLHNPSSLIKKVLAV